MKTNWIAGAVIAVLLGLNITQGAALLSLYSRVQMAKKEIEPIALSDSQINQLSPNSQTVIRTSLTQAKPALRARLREVRVARHELVRYISSPRYNRKEAQQRFDDLRNKSDQAQIVAQNMLLDAADKLPVQDRSHVVAAIDDDGDGEEQ